MSKLLATALFAVTGLGVAACAAESAIDTLKSEIPSSVAEDIKTSLPEVRPPEPDWHAAAWHLASLISSLPEPDFSVCEGSAIGAIEALSRGMSVHTHPTTENAGAIVAIARSCNSPKARLAAIAACSGGISVHTMPTVSVAQSMEGLCGNDMDCAMKAVIVLGNGISVHTQPTVSVAASIVRIVKQAPYAKVKSAAISSLSRGVSVHTSPTTEVTAAMVEIGNFTTYP